MPPYRNSPKYHNKKANADGHTFDSKRELERYYQLKQLEKRGEISDLELQKKFILIPSQRGPDTIDARGRVVKGKVEEKEVSYKADFVYWDVYNKEFVVEDVKGFRTKEYILKRKMMRYFHGIKIREV